jgi:hypothetical protein
MLYYLLTITSIASCFRVYRYLEGDRRVCDTDWQYACCPCLHVYCLLSFILCLFVFLFDMHSKLIHIVNNRTNVSDEHLIDIDIDQDYRIFILSIEIIFRTASCLVLCAFFVSSSSFSFHYYTYTSAVVSPFVFFLLLLLLLFLLRLGWLLCLHVNGCSLSLLSLLGYSTVHRITHTEIVTR